MHIYPPPTKIVPRITTAVIAAPVPLSAPVIAIMPRPTTFISRATISTGTNFCLLINLPAKRVKGIAITRPMPSHTPAIPVSYPKE